MGIYNNIVETVGKTPLVKLNKVTAGLNATIALKCEFFNPLGSVKDRIGMAMIEDAEKRGILEGRHRHHRTHQRQHRHRARVCRRRQGLQAHPDDA
jgi:threonine dehydratase